MRQMKKVIVTGGAGFIGSHIVDRLISLDCEVVVIDNLYSGSKNNINSKAKFLNWDISKIDPDNITDEIKDTDVIFHCAAKPRVQPSIENPLPFNEANVTGTLKILMLANKLNVKRVVYSASSSCYGNTKITPTPETAPLIPLSPYGLQKLIGEQYCRLFSEVYGLDTVCLRYFNVYGHRMPEVGSYSLVLAVWAPQKREGKPLTITNDGNQRRDFTYVDDVVTANLLAASHEDKLHGQSFNIGNGKSLSINEVADMVGGKKEYGEKRLEPFETLADNSKAKKVLGWKPMGDLKKYIKENY